MTEYNTFCYSEKFNDDNSFQQERYRAFNTLVGEKRYNEIKKLVDSILPKQGTLWLTDYWKTVTPEMWKQLLDIPEAKDFKKGFEFISGCKIEEVKPSLSGKKVSVELDGVKYTATID
jgi:hypothetical protein